MLTSDEHPAGLVESASLEASIVEKLDQSPANDADEWEEGSLPAAPTVPFFTQQDFVNVTPQPRRHENVVPPRVHNQKARNLHQYGQRTNGQPGRFNSPGHSPITDGEHTPYRPEIGGISSRRRGVQARQLRHVESPVDNAAYASYSRNEKHGGEYTFSEDWRQLLSDLHGDKTRIWAVGELNRLGRQTGTFIATPSDQSTTALIWGESSQVAYARAGLEEFEKSIRKEHAEKRKDFGKWERINALDGRKEHREERKAKVDEIVAQHAKLESPTEYNFEFWLLWPSQYLDFEQISASKLLGLRKNFWCTIDYDSTTSFVRIMANDERNLLQVVQRIVNLVKEMIAELSQVTKTNLLQLPSKPAYGSFVRVEKKESNLVIPILEDVDLFEVELDNWEGLLRNSRRSNRKEVGKALERCLKSLRMSQKYVGMRVNFGQLSLKQYQLPLDGSKHYKFDDFCTMIENERTILELHGLLCGADTNTIVDRCASHPMFMNPVETHSVHMDFKEPDQPTTLRLEKKFRVSHDYKDVFVEGNQWLEFPSGSQGSLLEVNMVDFENLDWQMTVNSAPFSESAKTSQHDWFQTNVTFKPTTDDIKGKPKLKGKPQRRVFFRSGGPKPTLVTELATITYELRGSDAKFELTRKDEYQQTQYGTEAGPPVSRLSGSFFYPNWDILLGQYAYLQPGGQVDWQPSLSTFFPAANGNGKANGLKTFMEEIREVQRVLAGKPAEAESSQSARLLTGLPNGVGRAMN